MRRPMLGLAIPLLLIVVADAHSAFAQDTRSFSTVDVSLGASHQVLKGTVDRFWRSGPAFHFSALTPYGIGALRFAVEAAGHHARSLEHPSYLSVSPSLEWGLAADLPLGLRGYGGAGVGAYWMNFGEGRNTKEIEMALRGTVLLARTLPRGWRVGAGVHAGRVLFDTPLNQSALFVEIGRVWRAPEVVRRTLAGPPPLGRGTASDPESPGTEAGSDSLLRPDDRHVSTARDLDMARLSDVFDKLPRWDRASVDIRTAWPTPEGIAPFEDARSDVLVDGIPVPLDLFGTQSLDRLPLLPGDVESLHAPTTPGLYHHRFRSDGALRFATWFPRAEGLSIHAESVAENATDDPGPFAYTDSAAQNVDKLGTGHGVGVTGRWGSFATAAGFKYRADFVTDAGLGGRPISLRDPNVHYPMITTHAGWASLRLEREGGRHALRVGRSVRDDYVFLPMVGFEVPTEIHFWHAGAAGEQRVGEGLRVRYQTYASSDDLRDSRNDLDLAFDLHALRSGLSAELARDGRLRWSAGGGMDWDRARSRFLPVPSARTIIHAQGGVAARLGAALVGVEGELRRIEGELSGDLALHGDIELSDRGRASLALWRSTASPDEQNGYWGLHDRGYAFIQSLGIQVDELEGRRERVQEGAHVEIGWALGGVRLIPFLRATRSRGLTIAQSTFVQEGRRPAHEGPVLLSRSASGSVLMTGVDLAWVPGAKVEVQARYRWLGTVGGDAFFKAAWAMTPTHRFQQRVVWFPRSDLRIAWGVEGRSATSWSAFTRMGRSRLAGSIVTDVSVDKTLWEGRAHLCARVSDVTDQERPLHPLGARPGLSFTVCGGIRTGR